MVDVAGERSRRVRAFSSSTMGEGKAEAMDLTAASAAITCFLIMPYAVFAIHHPLYDLSTSISCRLEIVTAVLASFLDVPVELDSSSICERFLNAI